jgi:hypothetical protein
MDHRNNPYGGTPHDQQDFVGRYRQGPQAVSEHEATTRYQQVAPSFPPRSISSPLMTSSPSSLRSSACSWGKL